MHKGPKNKIPIWENKKLFLAELSFIITSLVAMSDKDYQSRIWHRAEGPEVDWYHESILTFDYEVEYFRELVRNGGLKLTKEQIKSILRVSIMSNRFKRLLNAIEKPKVWKDEQLFIINHPYMEKIRRQAQQALSLIRIKE